MQKDKEWWAAYRNKNREAMRANARKYARKNSKRNAAANKKWRKGHPEMVRAQADRYREKHPEKARATNRLRKAVFLGEIAKPSICNRCRRRLPKGQIQGHHEDYSKPLGVEWLCGRCHRAQHRAAGG